MPLPAQIAGNSSPFLDRELSWLEFNYRVLSQAADPQVPLLERLKFLAIYHSNLDEFFMVRIGSLSDQALLHPEKRDEKTGWTASIQIERALQKIQGMAPHLSRCYEQLVPLLREQGIEILDCRSMGRLEELLFLQRFVDEIEPLLSPLIIDRSHPFPFLHNREQYVIARLLNKDGKVRVGLVGTSTLPAYLTVQVDRVCKLAFTSDLICHFLDRIFDRQKISERLIVRVTRNADLSITEAFDDELDFRGVMQELLKKRRRLAAVRLQCSAQPSPALLGRLCEALSLSPERVMTEDCPLDLSFGFSLPALLTERRASLSYPEAPPVNRLEANRRHVLQYFLEGETLLCFPFESIRPFLDLLDQAAQDPCVLSIQITLYRLASHSRIAEALCRAAEQGKQVTCLLELRARFDEQSNINYARLLEEAGCTVIYGLDEYKTHAKLCLITARRYGKLFTITQVGTGNYNEKTAEQYTDLSLITSHPGTGQDAARIFASLCKGEVPPVLEYLWVAPLGFKPRLLELIREEIRCVRRGEPGIIQIKVNSINDIDIMQALIEASQAGVQIFLAVRGICCIRPGLPGLTENITVKSLVGRYLEHSRIFAFGTGERRQLLIGSGDLLNRNTRRRIEVFVPVRSLSARRKLESILEAIQNDTVNGWLMNSDGSYRRISPQETPCDSHRLLWIEASSSQGNSPPRARRRLSSLFGQIFGARLPFPKKQ
ncbi:MAG: polyphosphate kinase 1 [Oscillospiraceae bacterium]|nr:MAG: polyphosphate kinase 1 [Oscillospiraceae bacterium]